MKDSLPRAAGYCRVSMREQVDGHSLEAQETNIREYAARQGWEVTRIYTDAGISAKRGSHRPALEALLEDARAHRFDIVIVDKIDRFYRHLGGLLNALERLNTWGVAFASVQEQLDFSTHWGKLTLTVLGILAEIYLDNLRQETRKGKLQRARKGLWNGNIPFGYCRGLCSRCTDPNGPGYCPDYGGPDKGDGSVPVPHPVERIGVERAFAWYASGEHSDGSITELLNNLKVHLPDGSVLPLRRKGTRGQSTPGPFTRESVRGMLTRIFYTGKVPYYSLDKHGKSRKRKGPQAIFPGRHLPLVDEDTFERVQQLRAARAIRGKRKTGTPIRTYPLTGILHCGYCGAVMRGCGGKQRLYRDYSRAERVVRCPQPSLKADAIEAQVVALLRRVLQNVPREQQETLQAQREALEARWQRARELYLLGEISYERYEAEKYRYETSISPLSNQNSSANIVSTLSGVLCDAHTWETTLPGEQKRLLQMALEAVFVRDNAIVAVQPKVALLPLMGWGGNCGPDGI